MIFTVSKDISAFAPLTAVSKRPDIGGLAPDALMAGEMPKVDDGGDGTNLGDDDHASWCVKHIEYPKTKKSVKFFFSLGGGRVEVQQKKQAGVEITMEKQGDRNVGQKVVYR